MKYVIFGAGGTGKWFFDKYCEQYDVECFCDSNIKKQGRLCLGLPVISPEELKGRALAVIIPPSKSHFEKAQQLFNIGIKTFYLVHPDKMNEVIYIDLSRYDDITPNPMRICAIETYGIGGSARALKKYNPYDDIDILLIERRLHEDFILDIYKNIHMYYAYFTSALFITQLLETIPGKKRIELWHGFTIKALWNATFSDRERNSFDFLSTPPNEMEAVCSYSRLYNIFFGYCAKVDQEKFQITGMPRNDLLLLSDAGSNIRKIFGEFQQKRVVFYLPTHRDYYDNEIDDSQVNGHAFFWPDFDPHDFNTFLQEHDILFIAKFHSYETERFTAKETANIRNLYDETLIKSDIFLYEMLGASDLLITDYSSVSADYLLLDKPIVFAARDVDEYSATRGLMTEPFDAWAPGETVRDYKGLKAAIYDALIGEDKYKDKREQMRRIMHKYTDAGSTSRVLDSARNILKSEKGESLYER